MLTGSVHSGTQYDTRSFVFGVGIAAVVVE